LTSASIGSHAVGTSSIESSNRTNNDTAVGKQADPASPVVDAISINEVPLDIASYGAILGSIKSAGGASANGAAESAAAQKIMTMIGNTLSQGHGGYYIACGVVRIRCGSFRNGEEHTNARAEDGRQRRAADDRLLSAGRRQLPDGSAGAVGRR
jgi:hypothetical protein